MVQTMESPQEAFERLRQALNASRLEGELIKSEFRRAGSP